MSLLFLLYVTSVRGKDHSVTLMFTLTHTSFPHIAPSWCRVWFVVSTFIEEDPKMKHMCNSDDLF